MWKTISILLIVVILCLLPFGCTKGKEESSTPPTTSDAPAPSVSGIITDNNQDELVWVIDNSSYAGYMQDDINRILREKGKSYSVKIKAIDAQQLDYIAELKNMMDSEQQADISYIPGNARKDNYYELVQNRMIEPLDSYLQSEAGKPLKDAIEPNRWEMLKVNGDIYGVNNPYFHTSIGYLYNKSLLEKYNIDPKTLKTDVFQNEEILMQIYEGAKAPIALWEFNERLLNYAFLANSPLIGYSFEDRVGKAVSVFEEPFVRAFLELMKRFKDKGYISSLNIEGYASVERINGYFALLYYCSLPAFSETIFSGFRDRSGDAITTLTVFVPVGINSITCFYTPMGAVTVIPSWSQKKEDALDFLTLLYTDPDVANLVAFGVENRDYSLDNKGRVEKRLEGSGYDYWPVWYTNDLITYPHDEQPDDKKALIEKMLRETTLPALSSFHFDPTPVQSELDAVNAIFRVPDIGQYTTEAADLLSGKVNDLDTALSAFQEKLKAAGIDRVVEEANRQIAEWKQKK